MRLIKGLALALALCSASPVDAADAFPTRPIRIVVPFAAGAINDTVARVVAEHLQKSLTAGVVVENRAGAGGMLGSDFVAKAAPDGYTLLLGTDDALSVLPAVKSLPYDSAKDFTPLMGFATSPFALAVRANLPVNDFPAFIAEAKAKPTDIKYASTGAGGVVHVGTALLEDLARIKLTHVAYRGMAPAVTDVVGGHVDMVLVSPATIAPHTQSGAVKVLALAAEARHPDLPQVPTSAELGMPDFLVRSTIGVLGPKGMPADVVARLSGEMEKVAADPGFRKRLTELGITPAPLPGPAYAARIAAERERWSVLAKRANLSAE